MKLVAIVVALALVAAGCAPHAGGNLPAEPQAGTWATWATTPDQIPVPPPPRREQFAAPPSTLEVEERARFWGDYPAVEPWMNLALKLVAEGGVKDPPLASRGYGLLAVAMHDATVAAWHWQGVYQRPPPDVEPLVARASRFSYPSEHAAIAGAAAGVLAYVFHDLPQARFDQLAQEAATSRVQAGANYDSDVEAGLALGRAVAEAVVARASLDDAHRAGDGQIPAGEGIWQPPPGSVAAPVQPLAGSWGTWALERADQLRPAPPPPYGSPQFLVEAREVLEISRQLTPEQQLIAKRWAGGAGTPLPPGQWNQILFEELKERPPLSLPRVARALALLNVALADAGVAAWDCKFAYWYPRPVNAIRDLGLDPGWKSYLPTPIFPSYVSGHSTYSAAAAEVLAYEFPDEADGYRAMADEAGISRIYAGIHFPSDNVAGLALGRQIGGLVVVRAQGDRSA